MSGLPPMVQVAFTLLVAKSMTETLPSVRLVTYSERPSRLGYSPCAPLPVAMNARSCIPTGSTIETPSRAWLAT